MTGGSERPASTWGGDGGTWHGTGLAERVGATVPGTADVCLIVEGCYPYVPGGVSAWIDWLMRSQPHLSFAVVSLWPKPAIQRPRYDRPSNVIGFDHLYLQDFGLPPGGRGRIPPHLDDLARALSQLTTVGGADALRDVDRRLTVLRQRCSVPALFNSPLAWHLVLKMYEIDMPFGSFLHYFWAWRALLGGLFAVLEYPLPKARVYHTISTGYAGLLAARATQVTGRPSLLTEHGIYTNERRIELLMADWVADTIDKGHALDDPRFDLRDMWVRAFEAYARTCYETASEIVTLYGDNQRLQKVLGADPEKLTVIANGIDIGNFRDVRPPPPGARPTIALIGRVVPIKDVETYIAAVRLIANQVPDLRALIMGPVEEDAAYAAECRRLITELGLQGVIELTGTVKVLDYLPHIHVAVLSSLSESQPLVLLEAGAAGVPYVATNVGSCRELIEGRSDESPALGPGGIVTDLVAPAQIAAAVLSLLTDEPKRIRFGETLRRRIATHYLSSRAVSSYQVLYDRLLNMDDAGSTEAGSTEAGSTEAGSSSAGRAANNRGTR